MYTHSTGCPIFDTFIGYLRNGECYQKSNAGVMCSFRVKRKMVKSKFENFRSLKRYGGKSKN